MVMAKLKNMTNYSQLVFDCEYFILDINLKIDKYYVDNKLITQGDYLTGIIFHRECKEYKNNKLISEGKYAFDMKNRKFKEYKDNNLIYEGEYLNSKRSGKGKEYYLLGKFEGEYLNGERDGKGKDIILMDKSSLKMNI